jgi:hypothetical protein
MERYRERRSGVFIDIPKCRLENDAFVQQRFDAVQFFESLMNEQELETNRKSQSFMLVVTSIFDFKFWYAYRNGIS